MLKKKEILYFVSIHLILFYSLSFAQDGQLDTSFADTGKVINTIGPPNAVGWYSEAHSTLIQSDGKIIVAGFARAPSQTFFALIRYNQNGIIDSSFGINGVDITSIGSSDDKAYSALIQPDGKIIAAGYATENYLHVFALVRYNEDGSLDNTFGSNGIVTTAVGKSDDKIFSIAIQQDGKVIAAGTSYENNQGIYAFALARYNTDGSLDNTFGTNGIDTLYLEVSNNPLQNDEAKSVAIQGDGKIVIGGYSGNAKTDFSMVRFNVDGSTDNSFGLKGVVLTPIGTGWDVVSSVAIQGNGKIVAAGYTETGYYLYGFALARYNTDGSLDNTFGTNGIVTTAIENSSQVNSVAIQSDGKIVVSGWSNDGSHTYFALARYNTNGSLDNTFGTNGITTTPFYFDFDNKAYSVAIQSDGKIVAAGAAEYNNFSDLYGFGVMRYTGSSGPVNAVSKTSGLPTTFTLYQNYPNPFNPSTTIQYDLPKGENVKLIVYDVLGREVASLVDAYQLAGFYKVKWNGKNAFGENMASGVFFYSFEAGNYNSIKKMIYLK